MLSFSTTKMSLLNGSYEQSEPDKLSELKKPATWVFAV